MHREVNRKLALEMAMQDVMDNMEEMAFAQGFQHGADCFEILAIEPAEAPDRYQGHKTGKHRDIFSQKAVITRLRVA